MDASWSDSRSEISVLGKREGGWVVRVTCSKCQTAISLLVFVGDNTDKGLITPIMEQIRSLAGKPSS